MVILRPPNQGKERPERGEWVGQLLREGSYIILSRYGKAGCGVSSHDVAMRSAAAYCGGSGVQTKTSPPTRSPGRGAIRMERLPGSGRATDNLERRSENHLIG